MDKDGANSDDDAASADDDALAEAEAAAEAADVLLAAKLFKQEVHRANTGASCRSLRSTGEPDFFFSSLRSDLWLEPAVADPEIVSGQPEELLSWDAQGVAAISEEDEFKLCRQKAATLNTSFHSLLTNWYDTDDHVDISQSIADDLAYISQSIATLQISLQIPEESAEELDLDSSFQGEEEESSLVPCVSHGQKQEVLNPKTMRISRFRRKSQDRQRSEGHLPNLLDMLSAKMEGIIAQGQEVAKELLPDLKESFRLLASSASQWSAAQQTLRAQEGSFLGRAPPAPSDKSLEYLRWSSEQELFDKTAFFTPKHLSQEASSAEDQQQQLGVKFEAANPKLELMERSSPALQSQQELRQALQELRQVAEESLAKLASAESEQQELRQALEKEGASKQQLELTLQQAQQQAHEGQQHLQAKLDELTADRKETAYTEELESLAKLKSLLEESLAKLALEKEGANKQHLELTLQQAQQQAHEGQQHLQAKLDELTADRKETGHTEELGSAPTLKSQLEESLAKLASAESEQQELRQALEKERVSKQQLELTLQQAQQQAHEGQQHLQAKLDELTADRKETAYTEELESVPTLKSQLEESLAKLVSAESGQQELRQALEKEGASKQQLELTLQQAQQQAHEGQQHLQAKLDELTADRKETAHTEELESAPSLKSQLEESLAKLASAESEQQELRQALEKEGASKQQLELTLQQAQQQAHEGQQQLQAKLEELTADRKETAYTEELESVPTLKSQLEESLAKLVSAESEQQELRQALEKEGASKQQLELTLQQAQQQAHEGQQHLQAKLDELTADRKETAYTEELESAPTLKSQLEESLAKLASAESEQQELRQALEKEGASKQQLELTLQQAQQQAHEGQQHLQAKLDELTADRKETAYTEELESAPTLKSQLEESLAKLASAESEQQELRQALEKEGASKQQLELTLQQAQQQAHEGQQHLRAKLGELTAARKETAHTEELESAPTLKSQLEESLAKLAFSESKQQELRWLLEKQHVSKRGQQNLQAKLDQLTADRKETGHTKGFESVPTVQSQLEESLAKLVFAESEQQELRWLLEKERVNKQFLQLTLQQEQQQAQEGRQFLHAKLDELTADSKDTTAGFNSVPTLRSKLKESLAKLASAESEQQELRQALEKEGASKQQLELTLQQAQQQAHEGQQHLQAKLDELTADRKETAHTEELESVPTLKSQLEESLAKLASAESEQQELRQALEKEGASKQQLELTLQQAQQQAHEGQQQLQAKLEELTADRKETAYTEELESVPTLKSQLEESLAKLVFAESEQQELRQALEKERVSKQQLELTFQQAQQQAQEDQAHLEAKLDELTEEVFGIQEGKKESLESKPHFPLPRPQQAMELPTLLKSAGLASARSPKSTKLSHEERQPRGAKLGHEENGGALCQSEQEPEEDLQDLQELWKQERHNNVVLGSRLEKMLQEQQQLASRSAQLSTKLERADTERDSLKKQKDQLEDAFEESIRKLEVAERKQDELLQRWQDDLNALFDGEPDHNSNEGGKQDQPDEFDEEDEECEDLADHEGGGGDGPRGSRKSSNVFGRKPSRWMLMTQAERELWQRRLDEAIQTRPLQPMAARELQEARHKALMANIRHDKLHERFTKLTEDNTLAQKMLREVEKDREQLLREKRVGRRDPRDASRETGQALKQLRRNMRSVTPTPRGRDLRPPDEVRCEK
ncbi:unnamed protein product [Polarella glacialis]|uniref:Uncharacterized protein n=1 Tax=Polarella glacialis TaxID=89957 RepID=A0A813GD96_POLGL|nr:unnamed protein product [Polarella glacialis]